MFHSDDNCTGQTIFDRTFLTDISPNSKQEDYPPLSLFHFPSPFFPYPEDENEVFLEHQHDLLPQQQQQQPSMNENTLGFNAVHPNKNMISDGSVVGCVKKQHTPTPVKRSSKKDRHSKINTAQGPRDRRMRLSLEIARKFFDLQDMLEFDKASKTVEWLLSKSKDAIEQVARDLLPPTGGTSIGSALKSTASSTSECEVLSGIDEMATIRSSAACVTNKEKKIPSQAPKRAAFSALARQSRKKARARARERTKEKMLWSKHFKDHSKPLTEATMNNQGLNLVASGNESGNSQSHIPETIIEEIEEPSSHNMGDIVDNDSMVKFYWSPSSIFNHLHNTGISQEFTDFQFYGKTWDQIL